MSFMKCSDAVNALIEDAGDDFEPFFEIDQERYDIFMQYCDAIDRLSDEFLDEAYEVGIDNDTRRITIRLECTAIVVKNKKHLFNEMVKRSVNVEFKPTDEGLLSVEFVFPSIWKPVKLGI